MFSITKQILARAKQSNIDYGPDTDISVGANDSDDNYNNLFTGVKNGETVTLKDLEKFSTVEPLTRNGLFLRSYSLWGKGFKILGDNKSAVKECLNVTKLPFFKEYLLDTTKHHFSYNDGYLENIWDDEVVKDKNDNTIRDKDGYKKIIKEGTNIIGFNRADPKSMSIKWNESGEITRYEQKLEGIKNTETLKFEPRQFSHIALDTVADHIMGLGLIQPLVPTIQTVISMSADSRKLIRKFSVPFVHVKKKGMTRTQVAKYNILAKSIDSSNSLASGDNIDIISPFKDLKIPDLSPNYLLHLKTLAGGLYVPLNALLQYGGDANKHSLTQVATWNKDITHFYQEKLATTIENQIFKPLLEAKDIEVDRLPQVVWNPLDEQSEETTNKVNLEYIKVIEAARKENAVTEEESRRLIRKKLNLDPEEDLAENDRA